MASLTNKTLFIIFLIIYITRLVVIILIKKEKIYLKKEAKKIIALAYSWMLISTTLFPILIPPVGINHVTINYNVLELFNYVDIKTGIYNVIGNIVLFIPMYFCININYKSLSGKYMYVASVLVSVLIEVLQLIENISGLADFTSRVTDINDVILNTLGGMIGWLIYETYKKIKSKKITFQKT